MVAIAVMAVMAFVGATCASATVLCATEPINAGKTCPEGWAYGKGTINHEISKGVVKLDTSFKFIECKTSTIEGEIESEGGATATVGGPVRALTFEECNCEVKVLNKGTQEFHWIEETSSGLITSNETEVTALCSTVLGNVHCIYLTNHGNTGVVTGGKPAATNVDETIPRSPTNSLCDEQATWTGAYEVTKPASLWFATATQPSRSRGKRPPLRGGLFPLGLDEP